MFLLFVVIVGFCVWFWNLFKDWKRDNDARQRAIKNGSDSYINRYGYFTDVNTNVEYKIERPTKLVERNGIFEIERGDLLKINPRTGNVIENLTQTEKQKRDEAAEIRRQEAKKNGRRFYLYSDELNFPSQPALKLRAFNKENFPYAESAWGDVITGEIYLIYQWNSDLIALWNVRTSKFEILIPGTPFGPELDKYPKEVLYDIHVNSKINQLIKLEKCKLLIGNRKFEGKTIYKDGFRCNDALFITPNMTEADIKRAWEKTYFGGTNYGRKITE